MCQKVWESKVQLLMCYEFWTRQTHAWNIELLWYTGNPQVFPSIKFSILAKSQLRDALPNFHEEGTICKERKQKLRHLFGQTAICDHLMWSLKIGERITLGIHLI
jgi:hypothetical protein